MRRSKPPPHRYYKDFLHTLHRIRFCIRLNLKIKGAIFVIGLKPTVKNKKIIFVILIAIVFFVVATFGVYKILTPQRTNIYIFADSYSAGTLVTESMLTPVEVDANIVITGSKFSTGDYYVTSGNIQTVLSSAGVLRNDVSSGTALMTSMLTTTGGNSIEMTMKKNAVAITVGANNVSGVTNELSSGCRVNVYANYDNTTTLILESIRVLSVSRSNGVIDSVTLEVDIPQSLQLVNAYNNGSIHLGLVDATGYQYSSTNMPSYNVNGFSSGE